MFRVLTDPLAPLWNQEAADGIKGEEAEDDSAETETENTTRALALTLFLSPPLFIPSSSIFCRTRLNTVFSPCLNFAPLISPSVFFSFCLLPFIFHSLFFISPSCGLAFLSSTFQLCASLCVCVWEVGSVRTGTSFPVCVCVCVFQNSLCVTLEAVCAHTVFTDLKHTDLHLCE